MKKLTAIATAITLAATLGIVACTGQNATPTETEGSASLGGMMQVANPWSEYATIDEAAAAAGFDMTVPDSIDGYDRTLIQAMENDMLEVRFTAGDEEINIRKSIDAYDGDNSGVYGEYTKDAAQVNGTDVTVSSEGDLAYIVTWTKDGYSYSVYASAGMATTDLLDIVAAVA